MSVSEAWRKAWLEKIKEAQKITKYLLGAKQLPRVKYGEAADDWGADKHTCGDCGAQKGQFHVPYGPAQ